MSDVKVQVGDKVKWTGKANGGHVEHEGFVERITGSTARVRVEGVNKRTGAKLKPKFFTPRLSALTVIPK